MPGYGGMSVRDYNKELSMFRFYTGNITAVSLPGTLTEFGALRTAVDGIILGVIAKESLKVFDTIVSNAVPASVQAQREAKWLVVYEDTLPFFDDPVNAIPNEGYQKVFTLEIPTPDLSLLQTNSEDMIIASGAGASFVTAFEAIARSPYGGTVNVLKITHVGRNL